MKTIAAAAAVVVLPLAPALANSGVVAVYDASPRQIWELVDFHGPSERIMPPIADSRRTGEGVGATKTNVLAGDGGAIELLLVYYEPAERAFNYTIESGPLPVRHYVGEVRVRDVGDGRAELTWQGTYEPAGVSGEQADEILGGFYEAIATRIGEMHRRVD